MHIVNIEQTYSHAAILQLLIQNNRKKNISDKRIKMGDTEKFCLRWNDFESNISGAFRELREDKDFFDVTLACDDDQMQAHKVILSACSPFFRSILRRNKHEHPLLYLKGVKYTELLSILNFMYMGEVNVAQEELNSFLSVAEDLKVKGLTQSNSGQAKSNKTNHVRKEPNHREFNLKQPDINPSPRPHQPHRPVENSEMAEPIPVKTEPKEATISQAYSTAPQASYPSQEPEPVEQTVALEDGYGDNEVEAYDYQYEEGYANGDLLDNNLEMTGAYFGSQNSSGKLLPR